MEFKNWINEARNQWNANNTIVVDIQPEYASNIGFKIPEFAEFLKQMLSKRRKVLYFYNGETIGSRDTDQEIKNWLISSILGHDYYREEYEDEDDQYWELKELFDDIYFYDKGYGFFRSWMDYGIDDADIIKVIRAMIMQRTHDTREMPEEFLDQLVDDRPLHDPIYLPHIDLMQLRSFNNAFLCGGGQSECLKEVQLLMNAMNIKYRVISKFTF